MDSYNLADAKARLSELVERAVRGEEIEIKRRGEPAAKIVSIRKPTKKVDIERLRRLTDSMEPSDFNSVDLLREMRDSRP
jgi:prevent-host-death family protein